MMKNVQQMTTIWPMGLSEDISVCTTSFKPGARLITATEEHVESVDRTAPAHLSTVARFAASGRLSAC